MISTYNSFPLRQARYMPTAEQDRFIRYWQAELEKLPTEQILRWAVEMFFRKLALVTSCGIGGSVLISMLGRLKSGIPIASADIGGRFGDTKRLYKSLEEQFDVRIETNSSPFDCGQKCCGQVKYKMLRRKAENFEAWISEGRRIHEFSGVKNSAIDWDERFGLFRIMPLARWTKQSLVNKAFRESIPFDEYSDRDYFDDDCHACLFSGELKGCNQCCCM